MTTPIPTDPVDWGEEQRRKADTIHFVLTVDAGDLEELAERQKAEGERHAALLEITRMIRKRERENAMEKEAIE